MHNEKVNKRSLAIVGMAAILFSTTLLSITLTDSTFARNERNVRDINQAASVSNSCLNPVSNSNTNDNMISNGNCGGTVSQQGKSGQASTPITVQNANPTIEVQRQSTTQPPTTTRETCVACFNPLSATEKSDFESLLPSRFPGTGITTIE
jgi:hypothetical protein